jgi:hypothetical protein
MKAISAAFNLSSSFVSIAATNNTNKIRKLGKIYVNRNVCLKFTEERSWDALDIFQDGTDSWDF